MSKKLPTSTAFPEKPVWSPETPGTSTATPAKPVYNPTMISGGSSGGKGSSTPLPTPAPAAGKPTLLQRALSVATQVGLMPAQGLATAGQMAMSSVANVNQALGAKNANVPELESTRDVSETIPGKVAGLGTDVTAAAMLWGAVDTAILTNNVRNQIVAAMGGAGAAEKTYYVTKILGRTITTNSKSAAIMTRYLAKALSKPALAFYGAWASSAAWGTWSHAEAIEAYTYNMNQFWLPEAIRTGDWSLVNEANEAAAEVADQSTWEKIGLASPMSALIGTGQKAWNVANSLRLQSKYIADKQTQQATGQDNVSYWNERTAEQASELNSNTDYFNAERLRVETELSELRRKEFQWEQEQYDISRAANRAEERRILKETAAFYEKQKQRIYELEAEERVRIMEFWLEYRKLAAKIQEDTTPSNLKFGLL